MSASLEGYRPHFLHAPDRAYRETNCYTDVLIELLHSRGLEPLAGFGHLVRTDFEGDQFTFFKMPQSDMEALYRVDIHEMQPVGSLPDQIALQLQHGRTMLVELDSFYLPDTSATDYRRNHVKSTVAIDAIDQLSETLIYFHNTGLFQLSSNDYRGIFRLDDPREDQLPPYLEIARFDLGPAPRGEELRATARECLRHHLRYRPRKNPFEAFAAQLARDLPILLQGDPESFHAYAFATVRMAGAAFDLLRAHVDWLLDGDSEEAFAPVVEGCQILSFRLARRRPFDPASTIDAMARAWASGMSGLELAIG